MAVSTMLKRWTLEELHRLPDDGNKYELIDGELFVTPAPTPEHETIIAKLARVLDRYVEAHALGFVYRARAVIQRGKSQVEPDLFVSSPIRGRSSDWKRAPAPILVVEVLSDYTRRRDLGDKYRHYLHEVGVPEYWMVDPESGSFRVARPGREDVVVDVMLEWQPATVDTPLAIDIPALFRD